MVEAHRRAAEAAVADLLAEEAHLRLAVAVEELLAQTEVVVLFPLREEEEEERLLLPVTLWRA